MRRCMSLTLSVASSFILGAVIVVALAAFILVVVYAARRPYFRHPRKPSTRVSGGVHQGDPRSVAPRRDEVVEPPSEKS